MRTRSKKEYLRTGFLKKRIYQGDGSYETIDTPFRYKSAGGTTNTSGQLMPGFMHIDGDATIEAITPLEYAVGDKVTLDNGEISEIIRVQTNSMNEFGRLRGIRRSSYTLTIT
jgi:hypothetical protein